jgi:hypothetical protein
MNFLIGRIAILTPDWNFRATTRFRMYLSKLIFRRILLEKEEEEM